MFELMTRDYGLWEFNFVSEVTRTLIKTTLVFKKMAFLSASLKSAK